MKLVKLIVKYLFIRGLPFGLILYALTIPDALEFNISVTKLFIGSLFFSLSMLLFDNIRKKDSSFK